MGLSQLDEDDTGTGGEFNCQQSDVSSPVNFKFRNKINALNRRILILVAQKYLRGYMRSFQDGGPNAFSYSMAPGIK